MNNKLYNNIKLLRQISKYRYLHIFLFLLLSVVISNGQNRGFDEGILDDETRVDSLNDRQDSIEVDIVFHSTVFSFNNILDTVPYIDSVLTMDFPFFNPIDASNLPLIDKGYIGSGTMPISGYQFKTGFDLGFHQYDFYKKDIDSYHWHENNAPFSSLFFSPGSDVNEFWTHAKFSKNFKDLSLDIDYNRINNIGKYSGQTNKHTDLNLGVWRGSYDSKFNTFVNFIAAVHEEEDNGGIKDKAYFDNSIYAIRKTMPVNLSDAVTRLENFSLIVSEYYRISDSINILGFKPYLTGQLGLKKGFYKFSDQTVGDNDSIYKNLLVDDIGLRNYITYNSILSNVGLMIVNPSGGIIKVGFDYQYWKYNQEPLGDKSVNQIHLFTNGNLIFTKGLNLDWKSKIYFGEYAGDLDFKTDIAFKKSIFKLKTGIKLGSFSPPLIMKNLYLTGVKVYENDFSDIKISGFNGSVSIPKIGLSIEYSGDLINNYIYFSDSLLPFQSDENLTLSSLKITENIGISIFHLDTDLYLFKSSSDILPIPEYTLKSKFYVTPKIFKKKLKINTGFEINYWDKYYNHGYNPAIGNFYVQNTTELDNYLRLDYFLSAKVSNLMFFLRFNNILFPIPDSTLDVTKIPYKVLDHPQSDMFWRLGVKWNLLN